MTKRILTLPAIALFLIFMTACGGSGGGEIAIVDEALTAEFIQFEPPANDDNRFASTDPIDTTDSVTAHTDNGIHAIFAGEDYIFTGSPDSAGFISNGDGARIRFAESLMSRYLDLMNVGYVMNDEHLEIQGTFYNLIPSDDSLGFLQGYGVAGVRTPPAVFEAQNATATYRGILELQKYQSGSSVGNATTDVLKRVLTMRVDFDAGMIGGESIDGSGTITFDETSISGNIDGGEFNGALTLDNAGELLGISAGTAAGHYAGIFFGPAADDVAGVVRINAVDGEAAVLAIGGFRADSD